MKSILIIFLLLPVSLRAQIENVYRAPYAIQADSFQGRRCNEFIASLKNVHHLGIAWLWHTFGERTECIDKIFADKRLDFVEPVLFNTTCVSNQNCGPYEIFSGLNWNQIKRKIANDDPALMSKVKAEACRFQAFLLPRLRPGVSCAINPLLEHKLSRDEYSKFTGWIQSCCAPCGMVWNPQGATPGVPPPPATSAEGHGPNPVLVNLPKSERIANLDGTDINFHKRPNSSPNTMREDDLDSHIKKYRNYGANFLWALEDNCNHVGEARKDPRRRDCSRSNGIDQLISNHILQAQRGAQ